MAMSCNLLIISFLGDQWTDQQKMMIIDNIYTQLKGKKHDDNSSLHYNYPIDKPGRIHPSNQVARFCGIFGDIIQLEALEHWLMWISEWGYYTDYTVWGPRVFKMYNVVEIDNGDLDQTCSFSPGDVRKLHCFASRKLLWSIDAWKPFSNSLNCFILFANFAGIIQTFGEKVQNPILR